MGDIVVDTAQLYHSQLRLETEHCKSSLMPKRK
jgi:hypothetical protein